MGRKRNSVEPDDRLNINRSDVPFPVLYGGVHIEMFGNRKMSLEGKYSIMEYTTEMLKVKLSKQTLTVMGAELSLCNVEKEAFLLTGKVSVIEFG